MNILAIETATETASVALKAGATLLEEYATAGPARAESVLAMIPPLLARMEIPLAALDVIAFGRGPGSFTGVRVAASVAQGLAFALDRPVAAVSSLRALAQNAGSARVLAVIDARQDEVYYGYFAEEGGLLQPCGAEGLCAPDAVPAVPAPADTAAVGSGADRYAEVLQARLGVAVRGGVTPTASAVALLAGDLAARGVLVAAEAALPVYLRDEVAKRPA